MRGASDSHKFTWQQRFIEQFVSCEMDDNSGQSMLLCQCVSGRWYCHCFTQSSQKLSESRAAAAPGFQVRKLSLEGPQSHAVSAQLRMFQAVCCRLRLIMFKSKVFILVLRSALSYCSCQWHHSFFRFILTVIDFSLFVLVLNPSGHQVPLLVQGLSAVSPLPITLRRALGLTSEA